MLNRAAFQGPAPSAHCAAPVRADSGHLTCPAFPVCPPSGLADPGVAPALRGSHPGGLCDLIRWPAGYSRRAFAHRRTPGAARQALPVAGRKNSRGISSYPGCPNYAPPDVTVGRMIYRRTPSAARQDAKRPASPPAQLQDSFGCGAFARSVSPRVRLASVLPLNECPIVPARGGQGSPPAAAAHGQRPAADGPAYHEKRPPISKPAGARAGKESTASVAGQRAGVKLQPRTPTTRHGAPGSRQPATGSRRRAPPRRGTSASSAGRR